MRRLRPGHRSGHHRRPPHPGPGRDGGEGHCEGWDFNAPDIPDMRYDGRPADGAAFEGGTDDESWTEAPGGPGAPYGRAARRRQRARWKKNQRRAVVATAFALVGGGLTFASMDRHSAERAEAAAAPDVASMGGSDGQAPEPPRSRPCPTHSGPLTPPPHSRPRPVCRGTGPPRPAPPPRRRTPDRTRSPCLERL
ncbi:hypothetical protein ACFQ0G_25575 [Streptomyces chiangmaiensis]